ncbi:MAG TPA: hypothetical protein VK176_10635 [Phycisphaerales bacterium]|nr:hypothetical protein [Phycisphaerales bacterium]
MRQISSNGRARGRATADPVSNLTSDIAAIRRDISNLIGTGAGTVSAKARETAAHLGEEAKRLAGDAKERYDVAHEQLAEATARRPVTTIVVSMAAGMVVGKMLSWALRRGASE